MSIAQPLPDRSRLFVALVAALVLWTVGVAEFWAQSYSVGTYWDEADYLNLMHKLSQVLESEGSFAAAKSVLWSDEARPPAYRLFALPLLEIAGTDIRMLRLLSLVALLASCALVFLAARAASGAPVAIVAAATFALSNAVMWTSARFGTDYVLYLATAGTFYSLSHIATRPRPSLWIWAGMVTAVALGALSKISYFAIAGPALLAFTAAMWLSGDCRRKAYLTCAATLAGIVIALPWWLYNYDSALGYARFASDFVREDHPWLSEFFLRLLGPLLTMLLLMSGAVVLARRRRISAHASRQHLPLLCATVAGVLPFLTVHILGPNHNMRLLSPVLIPLVILLAMLVSRAAATDGRMLRRMGVVAAALLLSQAVQLTFYFGERRDDVWNWEPLREMLRARDADHPMVVHMGMGSTLTPPSIAHPWVRRGESISEKWAWRHEDGPIDWTRISALLEEADAVVVPLNYEGDGAPGEDLDNQHNEEFSRLAAASGNFEPPVRLPMGRRAIAVLVFLRSKG